MDIPEYCSADYYYDSRVGLSQPFTFNRGMSNYIMFRRWDNMRTIGISTGALVAISLMVKMTEDEIAISKMLNPQAWREYERVNK